MGSGEWTSLVNLEDIKKNNNIYFLNHSKKNDEYIKFKRPKAFPTELNRETRQQLPRLHHSPVWMSMSGVLYTSLSNQDLTRADYHFQASSNDFLPIVCF